jgi:hypothetical protein
MEDIDIDLVSRFEQITGVGPGSVALPVGITGFCRQRDITSLCVELDRIRYKALS